VTPAAAAQLSASQLATVWAQLSAAAGDLGAVRLHAVTAMDTVRAVELIGELNSETNRNRAKLFVLQALALEPRVKQVLSVRVTQDRRRPTVMEIAVSLVSLDSDTPLNLVFPFFLEGGVTP
jgi:mRNA-degrading endonuclease toxin of MazEF toxin-antitoxin module